jgi:hypothetical protein
MLFTKALCCRCIEACCACFLFSALFLRKDLIHYSDYSEVVIMMSMGSAKKKPMTKKEREEKRRKHREKRLNK